MEQSLCELEAEEAKMGSIPIMEETTDTLVVESLSPVVHLLSLIDLFAFNSFFF